MKLTTRTRGRSRTRANAHNQPEIPNATSMCANINVPHSIQHALMDTREENQYASASGAFPVKNLMGWGYYGKSCFIWEINSSLCDIGIIGNMSFHVRSFDFCTMLQKYNGKYKLPLCLVQLIWEVIFILCDLRKHTISISLIWEIILFYIVT